MTGVDAEKIWCPELNIFCLAEFISDRNKVGSIFMMLTACQAKA